MKKTAAVLLPFLVFAGCGRRIPAPPRAEFSGVMEVSYSYYGEIFEEQLKGNFRLNGFENEFIVIFSDRAGVPRSEVQIIGTKVKYTGMKSGAEFAELLRYWTFLFNPAKGKKTDKIHIDDIKLKYSGWTKTEKGSFPGEVEIISPDIYIFVNITYGI